MNLRKLLSRMGMVTVKKKKEEEKEISLKDGPPIDKMIRVDEEKSYIVTKCIYLLRYWRSSRKGVKRGMLLRS